MISKKGPLVYFEKISISGNTKTRDKVIRRELKVYEKELYNGRKMKRGIRNLYYLDFLKISRLIRQKAVPMTRCS